MGLVKQAVSALTKRKIMQLTHTYITLPLSGERGVPMPCICPLESLLAHRLN